MDCGSVVFKNGLQVLKEKALNCVGWEVQEPGFCESYQLPITLAWLLVTSYAAEGSHTWDRFKLPTVHFQYMGCPLPSLPLSFLLLPSCPFFHFSLLHFWFSFNILMPHECIFIDFWFHFLPYTCLPYPSRWFMPQLQLGVGTSIKRTTYRKM